MLRLSLKTADIMAERASFMAGLALGIRLG